MSDVGIASVANFGILEYRSDAEPVDVVESSTAWTSANKSLFFYWASVPQKYIWRPAYALALTAKDNHG